jgi:hypothetical protein
MALLGSTIDPRLFMQDYSGFTRAADIQGQSMANLGGQIAGGIEKYGKMKQERKKLDAGIKATVTGIESAIKMGKSLGVDVESSLTPYLEKINDPNVSPVEAAAYAQQASNSISNVLNFGMKANEMGLDKRKLDIQEGQAIREALMKQAEMKSSKWQPYDKEIAIDGQKVKVTGSLDQFGQFKDINNNVYPSVADAFAPAKQTETPLADGAYPDGVPTDGTPMDGPGVLPLDKQNKVPEPDINFDFNQFPSVSGDAKVAPEVVANIEAAGGVPVAKSPALNLPLGASIVEEKPKEVRIITGQEAKDKGLDPAGTYEQTYENGKLVGIQTITPPPTISQIAQVEKSKSDIKASEAEVQKAQRSKDIAIKTMSDYVDAEGKPTERLDKAVGYGEAFATGVAEWAPFLGTQSGETRSDQDRLMRLVETDVLEAASLLKPVSNTDLLMLIRNRPTVTKPKEVWAKYFSDIKRILSNPKNYISSDGGSEVSTPKKPLSANDRYRAKIQPQGNR